MQSTIDSAEERLKRAEDQEESARLALAQAESTVRQSYFVVDAPSRPLEPERSKKELLLTLLLFLVAGFGVTFLGIVGGALLDDKLRFPIDVTHGLQLPVLTMINQVPIEVAPAYVGQLPPPRPMRQLTTAAVESFQPLRATLQTIPMEQPVVNQRVVRSATSPALLFDPIDQPEPPLESEVPQRRTLFR